MRPAAVLDACTLYSVGLRDTLLSIAQAHVFRPLWSAEDPRRGSARHPAVGPCCRAARIDRMLGDMRAAFPGAMVAGSSRLFPKMTNDLGDRRVLAAAVAGSADVIVTWNVRHFPPSACRPHGIAVDTPDDFLARLNVDDPEAVESALARQVARYVAPPMTVGDLLARHALRLPRFVASLRAGGQ